MAESPQPSPALSYFELTLHECRAATCPVCKVEPYDMCITGDQQITRTHDARISKSLDVVRWNRLGAQLTG